MRVAVGGRLQAVVAALRWPQMEAPHPALPARAPATLALAQRRPALAS